MKKITAVILLVVMFCLCAPSLRAEEDEFAVMNQARIDWMKIGLPAKDVIAKLSEPPRKGKTLYNSATGYNEEQWLYPDKGIVLHIWSTPKDGEKKTIGAIIIKKPCALKTQLGIGIGSTETEVKTVYAKYIDKNEGEPGKRIIAGSVYGGIVFLLKDGKVNEIFIGAAAE